jgi:uncharacterized 2Fe-2S/4Fe-4S cluster protein (DUF4445 family)
VKVRIGDRDLQVNPGDQLRDVLLANDFLFDFPCGGRASCGQCTVEVDPPSAATGPQRHGRPLACKAVLWGECTVRIKEQASGWGGAAPAEEMLTDEADRLVRKVGVAVPEPTLADQRSDWRRVTDALAPQGIETPMPEPAVLQDISNRLRAGGWRTDLLVEGTRLAGSWPQNGGCHGFAVDLGTTTVDVALYDLETGRQKGRRTLFNRQAAYGADVISRAQAFSSYRDAVRRAAAGTIAEAAEALLDEAEVAPSSVARTVVVGNPIMIHILLGLDPVQLTHAPYIPVVTDPVRRLPVEFGWAFQGRGIVETLPLISAFVGADTVGMIVALGLPAETGTSLALDIGTNGEIVLARGGRLTATSAAAGPAFEGAQIACGSRAVAGAITHVTLHPDGVHARVLGGGQARTICGTALIMAVAGMLERGVIDETGRIVDAADIADTPLRELRFEREGKPAFALTPDRSVFVTQKDVRELQLAKAAIRTAIESLLAESGLAWGDVEHVHLAGNFGAGMSVISEMRIGLLPPTLAARVDAVGNAALRGAALVLLSRSSRDLAASAARACGFVELAGKAGFQERFADAMMFPAAP